MPDDDRALMERLAALEAEVKADGDAQRARKEAALVRVREQRAKATAEKAELRERQVAIVKRSSALPSTTDDLGSAIELAGRANRLKGELQKKPAKGEKSWIKSGLASTILGPLGWLYAGSMREAVPASAAWILVAALAQFLPSLLLLPALMVVMPLSGIAGVVYALQYNRTGKRQRLWGDKNKELPEKTGQ